MTNKTLQWYIYAIALNSTHQKNEALDVLLKAIKNFAQNRKILEAIIIISFSLKKQTIALQYAKKLQVLEPSNKTYIQLLEKVSFSKE